MAMLLFVIVTKFHGRTRHEWVNSRAIAELLRNFVFLAMAGMPPSRDLGSTRLEDSARNINKGPQAGWFRSVIEEEWQNRPNFSAVVTEDDLRWLKPLIKGSWIEDQARFHARAHVRHETQLRNIKVVVWAIFIATATSVVLHLAHVGGRWPGFFAITLPGFGAAINGLALQREHQRHKERFEQVARQLLFESSEMDRADTLPEIRRVVSEVRDIMLSEASDWFGIMRVEAEEGPV
jgi:hypothetical protein